MLKNLHHMWSSVVDGVAFGAINLIQLRQRAGTHDVQTFENFIERWKGAEMEDYYAFHTGELPQLPEAGAHHFLTTCLCDQEENNQVHAHIWPGPKGKKSPAMILLHGFMSVSDVGYRIWAKHLNKLGWTAIFFDLPYHYRRKPQNSLSGEMAISSHLIRTAEGIRQGVIDLRRVCQSLKHDGAPYIGCWATSYGGWLASILCVVENSLSTAWLIEPISDVEHAIWKSPAAISLRWQLAHRKILCERVAEHVPFVCPTYHQPVIPKENILLVAGLYDSVAPVQSIRALHQHWQGSHYAEIPQGHVGYQLMPASWRLAQQHMPNLPLFR